MVVLDTSGLGSQYSAVSFRQLSMNLPDGPFSAVLLTFSPQPIHEDVQSLKLRVSFLLGSLEQAPPSLLPASGPDAVLDEDDYEGQQHQPHGNHDAEISVGPPSS
ncbi:hypothetical protein GL325_09355 [Aeromicrobium sp. 636]|uniref:Uncharacterized protein n=1 Tax=Aeromicrobium senzhongii TaxID=2663859 RepID=A0A8I0EWC5_9ACTN|nr:MULTISPECIES: hypothetical protein [Aeromicrobium]MBC9226527.1 hypothetical protein [Aeromicrobium senzhongii]MCQ3998630.1 hypothetical protein [Aeromicrobium sp. 636]